jgi:hypothetical protein
MRRQAGKIVVTSLTLMLGYRPQKQMRSNSKLRTREKRARDALHNPHVSVAVRMEIVSKASFLANSHAIGKKSNAADCPRPRYHRLQAVMQNIPKFSLWLRLLTPFGPIFLYMHWLIICSMSLINWVFL